jgi:hypothetical protein
MQVWFSGRKVTKMEQVLGPLGAYLVLLAGLWGLLVVGALVLGLHRGDLAVPRTTLCHAFRPSCLRVVRKGRVGNST